MNQMFLLPWNEAFLSTHTAGHVSTVALNRQTRFAMLSTVALNRQTRFAML